MGTKTKTDKNRAACRIGQINRGYAVIRLSDIRRLMRQADALKGIPAPSLKDWIWYLYCRSEYVLAACLICTFLSMFFTARFVIPEYKAVSKLFVSNSNGSSVNLSDLQMGTYLASDYKEVFNIWYVHERVLQKLDLPYSYTDLEKMLKVENPPDTRLLYITVTSNNAEEAKRIADAYAVVAREFIAASMKTEEPYLFEEALVPSFPSSPRLTKSAFKGYFGGMVGAYTLLTILFFVQEEEANTAAGKSFSRQRRVRY